MRLASLLVLVACRSSPPPPASTASGAAPAGLADAATEEPVENYPSYPGARALTDGRVYGAPPSSIHISWTTMATKDAPETVVAHYEKLLGRRATTDGKTWSFNTKRDDGSTWVSHTLEIIPAAIAKDYPGRDVPPAAGERTVIMTSVGMGPNRDP